MIDPNESVNPPYRTTTDAEEVQHQTPYGGMSIRTYLAGQALAGLMANSEAWKEMLLGATVNASLKAADLLITELNKQESK